MVETFGGNGGSGGSNGGEIIGKKQGNMYIMEQVKTTNTNKNIQNTKENKKEIENYQIYHASHDIAPSDLHISTHNMEQITRATTGINIGNKISTGGCEGCHLGKSHSLKFVDHNSEPKPESIMDMVVADLCGPIYGYIISGLIEVASGAVHVKIIKKKSDTAQDIMECVTWAQTQTGKTLKRFHSDGGGEYISKHFL